MKCQAQKLVTVLSSSFKGQTGSHWIAQYYSLPFNLRHAYVSAERVSSRHLSLLIQKALTEGQCQLGEAHWDTQFLCGLHFPHGGEENP